jgi:hypothetical protein
MNILLTIMLSITNASCTDAGKIDLVGMSSEGAWAGITHLAEVCGELSSSKTYFVIDVPRARVFASYDSSTGPTAFNSLGISMNRIEKLDARENGTLIRQRRGEGTWELRLKPSGESFDIEFKPELETEFYDIAHIEVFQHGSGGVASYRISGALATVGGPVIILIRTLIPGSETRVPDGIFVLNTETRTCVKVQN